MDMRRAVFVTGACWIGLCAGLMIAFVVFTIQYAETNYTHSWSGEWLVYHMIDLRWRAAAISGLIALPGVVLVVKSTVSGVAAKGE